MFSARARSRTGDGRRVRKVLIRDDGGSVWTVARTDGGPFPIFTVLRGEGPAPVVEQLETPTREAVDRLLPAVVAHERVWIVPNISAALMMAATDVLRWQGLEEPIETTRQGDPTMWAAAGAPRTPYTWLRATGSTTSTRIETYDGGVSGLSFVRGTERHPPSTVPETRRLRSDIPLVRGTIRRVDVAFDTTVAGRHDPGVVTEVLLHGDHGSTLLIAAQAYYADEWHHAEDAVTALPDLATADALPWTIGRPTWRSPDLGTN